MSKFSIRTDDCPTKETNTSTHQMLPGMAQTTQRDSTHCVSEVCNWTNSKRQTPVNSHDWTSPRRETWRRSRLVHPTMPGNLDPPGNLDTQTPTTWSGRVQRQTRKVKPRKHRKHKRAAKRTFPKPHRHAPHPKSHKGNPPYNKLLMPSRTTQVWGCLCLPRYGPTPPHRYGPVYASMPLHRYGPV